MESKHAYTQQETLRFITAQKGLSITTETPSELPTLEEVTSKIVAIFKFYNHTMSPERLAWEETQLFIAQVIQDNLTDDDRAVLDSEWRGADNAYELRGDNRKAEGNERDYETHDSRSHQTHHITDGLSEALLLKLSPEWLDEEAEWTDKFMARGKWARAKQSSDWEYWLENHHVQAICHICHMATSEIGCTDCNTAIAVPTSDGDCFPNICSIVEACKFHAGELPSKREERIIVNAKGEFVSL